MSQRNKAKVLEAAIIRYYERFSAKRIALSIFLVGFLCLSVSLAVYWIFQNGLYAALAGLLAGFIGINIAFMTIVPPAKSLNCSRDLICAAIKDPTRIKSYDMNKVELNDAKGKPQALGARELRVWTLMVVPYLMETQTKGETSTEPKPQRKLTASERKYLEQRRKEVLELEKKIGDERKDLDKDREELELRTTEVNNAEEMVISRLNGVEQAEAELEQLKIVAAERADMDDNAYDAKAAEAKAVELQAKEAELVKLREHLAEERQNFDSQKAELNRLEKKVTRAPFPVSSSSPAEQSIEAREAALEERMKQLEMEAAELEERASYVADSENLLIERLDALTEREANIEQNEVNAGLRKD